MRFEFSTANRIIFGEGSVAELPAIASALGRRALFVIGKSPDRMESHRSAVEQAGVRTHLLRSIGEPTVSAVQAGVTLTRDRQCDMVIALGGGSVLDTGKAIAGLAPNPGEIYDYLEVVGKGLPLPRPALPFVAVPTTAGTGSEVTRNAVLSVPDKHVKVSLRHASMLPRTAIVDPQLTYGLPRDVTASAGLDALVQLIEPYTSSASNPMVDALCREGILRVAHSLRRAWLDGSDAAARADMSLAALFSGMALANAKLGAVHGFAGPIGGRFEAPHGAVCAALLTPVLWANLRALRDRAPTSGSLQRLDALGPLLTGDASAGAEAAIVWIGELCSDLRVPNLGRYGISPGDFPELIDAAKRSSSMKGNPIVLTDVELQRILEEAS